MISQISTVFSRSPRFHKQNARLKLFQESRTENYAQIEEATNFAGCSLSNLVDTLILTVVQLISSGESSTSQAGVNVAVGRFLKKSVVLSVGKGDYSPEK